MDDISRQNRINYKVIVDCYDEYEMARGWFYYLHNNLNFPFKAFLLNNGDKIEVLLLINNENDNVSIHNFIATIRVKKDEDIYDIPLDLIKGIDCDEATDNVIEDWRYWCEKF